MQALAYPLPPAESINAMCNTNSTTGQVDTLDYTCEYLSYLKIWVKQNQFLHSILIFSAVKWYNFFHKSF